MIRRFRLSDLEAYRGRVQEAWAEDLFAQDGLEVLETDRFAETMVQDNVPVASAGLRELNENMAMAWALTTCVGAGATALHRAVRRYLTEADFARIETLVAWDYHKSHRWVELLGFVPDREAPVFYGPDRLYARYIYGAG